MKIADLYKIISEQGFTPEIRKQVEEGTYSSKDIADLMETMAASNSALEKKLAELEGRIDYKKTDTDQNTGSLYPPLGIPLPALASKKEAKNAIKLLKTYHLKGTISDTIATEMTKTYQSRLEEIAKNSWYYSMELGGCAFASALCGIAALVAAGLYVGSYLAAAEIGALIGGIIPPVVCTASQGALLDDRAPKVIGTVFGALAGAAGACIAYGIIPDFASQGTMNVIGKGVLSGGAGGVIGVIAAIFYAKS